MSIFRNFFAMEHFPRKFVCYFYFVGWEHISLGASLNIKKPDLEIHLPFGFFRIGWTENIPAELILNRRANQWKCLGWN